MPSRNRRPQRLIPGTGSIVARRRALRAEKRALLEAHFRSPAGATPMQRSEAIERLGCGESLADALQLWLQIAIAASDGIVVVVQPHEFSADGIRDLMQTVHAVQEKVNPDLVIDGLIINGVRPTTGEHAAWVDEYRKQFGDAVLEPPLPERIVFAEAQRLKVPLEFYMARGAAEPRGWFRHIAEQLIERTGISASGAILPDLGEPRGDGAGEAMTEAPHPGTTAA